MDSSDIIEAIHDAITQAAGSIGINNLVATDLAQQVEDRLRLTVWGKDIRYISRVNRTDRARRIRDAFNGDNIVEIAKSESISTRQVRRILYGK